MLFRYPVTFCPRGKCCRASVALVDDVSVAFSNSENSKDCQLILGARGIRATKVTEKGSLGTTTRAAMEISCEQVGEGGVLWGP